MKQNISAVIITKNEEKNISKCLAQLRWVDEVIIIDDFSADGTQQYALECKNVKFYENKFIDFAAQRNFAASRASFDWILSVDADEVVNGDLKEEILKVIEKNDFVGYKIPTKNFFCGRWMKYGGWYPNYHIRLFKKEAAAWRGATDEAVEVKGKIGFLKNPILHFGHNTFDEWHKKNIIYAGQKAEEEYESGTRFSYVMFVLSPLTMFFKMYFLKMGFLDGLHGIKSTFLMCRYKALIWLKIRELEKQRGK